MFALHIARLDPFTDHIRRIKYCVPGILRRIKYCVPGIFFDPFIQR